MRFLTIDRAVPELQFTNSTAQEGRNTLCLEPQGHCRHQGHVGASLVPCHTVGHGGGCQSCCQCILLPAAASSALWPLRSGHMPLSPAAPGYSGHQLLALSLVPRQTILSQRGNPLSSYPAPVCQGTPSRAGQVYTSTTASLSRLDEQTKTLPFPWCPPSARCQLLSPARGHRQ